MSARNSPRGTRARRSPPSRIGKGAGGLGMSPNILLIMTDEHRADCLGIAGYPVVQTPNLDAVAAAGVRFERAYSACPVCVPARRTLLTGQCARTHGVFTDVDAPLTAPTLPGELS